MTQPDYVPLRGPDRMRPSDRLTLPAAWRADRPGDLAQQAVPAGNGFGQPGPDVGYGMKLAKRFTDRLVLTVGEHTADVVAGCFACGAKRAASIGRAPVIWDMEWAFALWGYLAEAPERLVDLRVPLFRGAAHHYGDQRAIVDAVAAEALVLTPAAVAERVRNGWENLFVVDPPETIGPR
ncbi:MAG: hypothetical protein M3063_07570 [Actinomycetota bacterium]|nr:hypothetical protein [Actinomycetota bacterium]